MALTLFTNDPLFSQLDNVFDRAFDRALGRGVMFGFPHTSSSSSSALHPVDVVETTKAFEIHADVPGLTHDDIKVELKDGNLSISGEKRKEKRVEDGGRVLRQERSFTRFSKSLRLPDNVQSDHITADLQHGVLKVVIPKLPEAPKPEPKRITVGQGSSAGQDKIEVKTNGSA